jgi:hypothetical protein
METHAEEVFPFEQAENIVRLAAACTEDAPEPIKALIRAAHDAVSALREHLSIVETLLRLCVSLRERAEMDKPKEAPKEEPKEAPKPKDS